MELEDVLYGTEGHIATITLDREDARNAYTEAMVDSLVKALDAAEQDEAVRCVILTGAGRAFSAGGDLKRMQEHSGMFEGGPVQLRRKYIDGIQRIPRRLGAFDKPVIAAMNGAAVGAGLDLACMCDLRIGIEGAKFGSTFVKVGLVPGDGGAYFLGRTIGFSRALELVLTGRMIDTEEALTIGLINRVVTREGLMSTAIQMAEAIAANASVGGPPDEARGLPQLRHGNGRSPRTRGVVPGHGAEHSRPSGGCGRDPRQALTDLQRRIAARGRARSRRRWARPAAGKIGQDTRMVGRCSV